MESSLVWQLHPKTAAGGLGTHREAWDRLNQHLMAGHSMLESMFIDALLRHFGERGAQLAVARQGEEPVAMLLLNAQTYGLGVWSSFLPSQTQIGPSLIPEGLCLRGLFAALPGYASELDLLCNDPRFGDLRELSGCPVQCLPHALTMSISLRGSFDDYWAQRPRKLIQNMRRYQRRLQQEAGEVRFRAITTVDEMPAALARYAKLEGQGWKGRQGTAVVIDDAQGKFYAELLQVFAARGQAVVHELWLGDALLASRMLVIGGQMAVMLKTAFSEAHERVAPGRILLQRSLEDLFERLPGGVVEFCTNADQDLLAWSTAQRWVNHVSVYRQRGLPVVFDLVRRSTRAWRRRTRHTRLDVDTMAARSGATVDVYAHPRDLPADAVALLKRREQEYIEFGADWLSLLADSVFTETGKTAILVLRRQGRVLAVLPSVVQQGTGGREVTALANYYTTLFSPAIEPGLRAEDLLPLTVALRRNYKGTPAYRFAPMDPKSADFGLLRDALGQSGLKTFSYFAFGNWYLETTGGWADYLKNRSGQLRSTIKRMTKRLAAENGRLEIIRAEADVERGIAAYQTVYNASWKTSEPYAEFIPGLIRLCARRGWLRLGIAWVADRPIAAQLWMVSHGRAHIYKVAYDEAFKNIAPGTLVTALLIEEAIERDHVSEIDYLIGDDAYKKTWMSHRRERFGLVAFDPLTPRGLLGFARQTLADALRPMRHWWAQRHAPPLQAAPSTLPPDPANA